MKHQKIINNLSAGEMEQPKANIQGTPADMNMRLYYQTAMRVKFNYTYPQLIAFDELSDGRTFQWIETTDKVHVLVFTPRFSFLQLGECLSKGPQDVLYQNFSLGSSAYDPDSFMFYGEAAQLSDCLKIDCPQILFTDHLSLAGILCNNEKLPLGKPHYILLHNQNRVINFQSQFKTLVHEMRHAWQHYTDPDKYFSDYHDLDYYRGRSKKKIDQYFQQEAELDAEAYALAYLHLVAETPLNWGTHSEETDQILESRAREYLENPEKYLLPQCGS